MSHMPESQRISRRTGLQMAIGGLVTVAIPTAAEARSKRRKKNRDERPVAEEWTYIRSFGAYGDVNDLVGINTPSGITFDPEDGTLYLSESRQHCVSTWVRNGSEWDYKADGKFGTQGSGVGQLRAPEKIALAADRRTLYVADTDNSRIAIWSRPDHASLWKAHEPFGEGVLEAPTAVIVTRDGRTAYVADETANLVRTFTRTAITDPFVHSKVLDIGGTSGDTRRFLDAPKALYLTPDELTLGVVAADNDRVSLWSRPNTKFDWKWATNVEGVDIPHTARLTPDGTQIFVPGSTPHVINRFAKTDGVWTAIAPLVRTEGLANAGNYLDLAFAPDGRTMLVANSGTRAAEVEVWQLRPVRE